MNSEQKDYYNQGRLDEQATQMKVPLSPILKKLIEAASELQGQSLLAFAQWLDEQRNSNSNSALCNDHMMWCKPNAFQQCLRVYLETHTTP